MELLLNHKTKRGVTRYLVRWRGHTSADDEWGRSCFIARRKWLSLRRVLPPATLALTYPPLPPPFLLLPFCSRRSASGWRRRRNSGPGRRWWASTMYVMALPPSSSTEASTLAAAVGPCH